MNQNQEPRATEFNPDEMYRNMRRLMNEELNDIEAKIRTNQEKVNSLNNEWANLNEDERTKKLGMLLGERLDLEELRKHFVEQLEGRKEGL